MPLRDALLAALVAATPFAAQAQPVTGLYIGAGGGVNIMLNEPVNSIGGTSTTGLDVQTDVGGAGVVSLGWGFGNGLRAEIEGDYRYNSLDKVTGPGGSLPLNGSEQKFGPMVNALYDFATISPVFVPYVGVGVGYQWAHERMTSVPGSPYFAANSAGAFAYQAIIGAAIPIALMPGLAFTAEYRFMA